MSIQVSQNEIFHAFSESLDLIDRRIYNHHNDVAYIALKLASALDLSQKDIKEITIASLIHDIGVFTADDRVKLTDYAFEDITNHGEIGYQLLMSLTGFDKIALLVRYHHDDYPNLIEKPEYNLYSNLIFLADRIAVLIDKSEFILNQVDQIKYRITSDQDVKYMGEYVNAFLSLSRQEEFWLNLTTDRHKEIIMTVLKPDAFIRDINALFDISKLFILAIDFRSSYTASHSIGVSKVARAIGQLLGYDHDNLDILEISGYFHDIGKLALSKELLDKKSILSKNEMLQIKSHSFYTMEILSKIKGFEEIKSIASSHHEKLNGKGYPFKRSNLTEKEMILCIADIFSALTEERPYRSHTNIAFAKEILLSEGNDGKLDLNLIQIVIDHMEQLSQINHHYQALAAKQYSDLQEAISKGA
ncbi:HD-GYP domain-containing protein [Fusibacter sp. 3D3]|uniref:HD-GYP domain-containing protein n=1 Tax=Fusibacter sp. 3D3 TaxID=1048380 RepID=UPI000853E01C|nr:HD domain-containing phosphohydrolase [Fusibacter sp. 3D3]GAU79366.1 respondse regulator protein CheY-like [Fusibacter sp. 3D3]